MGPRDRTPRRPLKHAGSYFTLAVADFVSDRLATAACRIRRILRKSRSSPAQVSPGAADYPSGS
jgi:hypothetical protein